MTCSDMLGSLVDLLTGTASKEKVHCSRACVSVANNQKKPASDIHVHVMSCVCTTLSAFMEESHTCVCTCNLHVCTCMHMYIQCMFMYCIHVQCMFTSCVQVNA